MLTNIFGLRFRTLAGGLSLTFLVLSTISLALSLLLLLFQFRSKTNNNYAALPVSIPRPQLPVTTSGAEVPSLYPPSEGASSSNALQEAENDALLEVLQDESLDWETLGGSKKLEKGGQRIQKRRRGEWEFLGGGDEDDEAEREEAESEDGVQDDDDLTERKLHRTEECRGVKNGAGVVCSSVISFLLVWRYMDLKEQAEGYQWTLYVVSAWVSCDLSYASWMCLDDSYRCRPGLRSSPCSSSPSPPPNLIDCGNLDCDIATLPSNRHSSFTPSLGSSFTPSSPSSISVQRS